MSEEDKNIEEPRLDDETKKLTKKQKKALEFRNKKKKDKKIEDEEVEVEGDKEDKDKKKKKKKDKKIEEEKGEGDKEVKEGKEDKKKKKKKEAEPEKKKRYIVFVGNLPYDATVESLTEHLGSQCEPFSVRLPKSKTDASKISGYAFVEFSGPQAFTHLTTCVNYMHHSQFHNRRINIELTAGGGGGKSEKRRERIKEKNAKLDEERKQLRLPKASNGDSNTKKRSQPTDDNNEDVHPSRRVKINR